MTSEISNKYWLCSVFGTCRLTNAIDLHKFLFAALCWDLCQKEVKDKCRWGSRLTSSSTPFWNCITPHPNSTMFLSHFSPLFSNRTPSKSKTQPTRNFIGMIHDQWLKHQLARGAVSKSVDDSEPERAQHAVKKTGSNKMTLYFPGPLPKQ